MSVKIRSKWKRNLVKFFLRKIILPFVYNVTALLPVKENLVVFADAHRDNVPDSMQLVYDKMVRNNMDIRLFFHDFRKDGPLASLIYKIKFMITYARARYVFVADYFMPIFSCNKREETVVVQLWHGCGAFKKWGYSTLGTKFGVSENHVKKYPIHTNYTYVTVSSEEVRKHYAEAFNMTDRLDAIKAVGVSRTDVFFDEGFLNNSAKEFYDKYPMAKGKKIILYAPTFRGTVRNPKTQNPINMEEFYEKLKDDYILVFKLHPFMKGGFEIPDHMSNFALDVSSTMSIDQMLTIADICISDYSSLIFEYSLFEKPMIFFPYDYEEYVEWRGFYYEYHSFLPGPIVEDDKALLKAILDLEKGYDKQKLREFRDKFMGACDGKATERIIELVQIDK